MTAKFERATAIIMQLFLIQCPQLFSRGHHTAANDGIELHQPQSDDSNSRVHLSSGGIEDQLQNQGAALLCKYLDYFSSANNALLPFSNRTACAIPPAYLGDSCHDITGVPDSPTSSSSTLPPLSRRTLLSNALKLCGA